MVPLSRLWLILVGHGVGFGEVVGTVGASIGCGHQLVWLNQH